MFLLVDSSGLSPAFSAIFTVTGMRIYSSEYLKNHLLDPICTSVTW